MSFTYEGKFSHCMTRSRAANQFITAKMIYVKMCNYDIELTDEIIRVEDDAIETLCGTNSRAEEFIDAFYNNIIDVDTLIDYLTTAEEVVNEIEVNA